MTNEEVKKLCLSLVKSEREEDVINLLIKANLWEDLDNWVNYGKEENNWSIAGNQQGRPETALVEKLINSVDSILTSECCKAKIDPSGDKAPENISKAVNQFFGIYEGKLSNITPNERSKLAENIGLVATGEPGRNGRVCYSVYDLGEGQSPHDFPETFLSLGKSNKVKIPFVQGKFNMGGTGVLRFCGRKHLQLIVSKKNPDVPTNNKNDETKDLWGFSVVRRVPPTGNFRSSRYVYLAPNGNVLSFKSEGLNILPGKYPQPYERDLKFGTYIKLYDYQLTGLKANITLDLYNRLSLLMPSLALPIRLYERRQGYKAHTLETTLNGLSVRLEEDKRNNLESEEWPSTHDVSVMGENFKVSVYAFKRNLELKKKPTEKYIKDEGIIFTVNGQTHGSIHKRFFSRKIIGLGNLADSLIVMVNCSAISGETREDLFMNSRDRLVDSGEIREQIEKELIDIIRNHQGLKALQHKRHKEDIENRLDDSKPLSDVLEKIMKKSPVLARLFISGQKLSNPIDIEGKASEEKFEGKRFPTYFKLIKDFPSDNPKCAASNTNKARIQFKTDALNDYFERETDKGVHTLYMDKVPFNFSKSMNLWNGFATLNIEIPDYLKVGDIIKFRSEVNDIGRVEPFIEEFHIKITEETRKSNTKQYKRKKPPKNENGNDSKGKSGLALPEIIKVAQPEWNQHEFDKESALKVEYNGEELGWTFFINVHNIHLLSEQKSSKNDTKLIEAQYTYAMVLLGLSMINKFDEKNENGETKFDMETTEMVKVFSSSISPVLIPMISTLGELKESEVVAEF